MLSNLDVTNVSKENMSDRHEWLLKDVVCIDNSDKTRHLRESSWWAVRGMKMDKRLPMEDLRWSKYHDRWQTARDDQQPVTKPCEATSVIRHVSQWARFSRPATKRRIRHNRTFLRPSEPSAASSSDKGLWGRGRVDGIPLGVWSWNFLSHGS